MRYSNSESNHENKNFRKLFVWQKAFELVKLVYKATNDFPKTETYGLTSQLRRSAVSIPSNIAEGYMRKHVKEYVRFLNIALGSTAELQTQALIALELFPSEMTKTENILSLSDEVTAMLIALIRKLEPDDNYIVRETDLSPFPFPLSPASPSPSGDANA